jgi:hypothetical protein
MKLSSRKHEFNVKKALFETYFDFGEKELSLLLS